MIKKSGRPLKQRVPGSGIKLQKALGLLGKSYGTNRNGSAHVCNWKRWIKAKLPKSLTTIREDIKNGITEDRIQAYAACFQISTEILYDQNLDPEDNRFINAVLAKNGQKEGISRLSGFIKDAKFLNLFKSYNSPDYLSRLLDLTRGVYDCYWKSDEQPDDILRCALSIRACANDMLLCRAAYHYYQVDNHIQPAIFRWMNNLHFVSMADDYKSLFHAMFIDPLKIPSIVNGKPFSMLGISLSEDGEMGLRPMVSRLYLVKLPESDQNIDQIYAAKVKDVLADPYLSPENPIYQTILQKMNSSSFY